MGPIRLGSEKVWVRFVLGPKRFGSESSQKFWVRVVLGPSCLTFHLCCRYTKTCIRISQEHKLHVLEYLYSQHYKALQASVAVQRGLIAFHGKAVFSSPEPSGSQGELIVYPCSVVRPSVRRPSVVRPSVVRRPPFSKIFSSETAWPIKAKFYMKHLWEGGTNVYINNPGHMTKMAAMPIYGKNPSKIFFSGTTGPISTKLGMKH